MENKISLYMTNFKNETYEFPIAPSEFEFKRSSGNDKNSVINVGEIIRLANNSTLGSVDLNIKIPIDLSRRRSYWSSRNITWSDRNGGNAFISLLNDMFERHEVVRVVLTNTRFNFQFVFDDFSYKLSDSADEYDVSITMTEWRDYDPIVLKKAPVPAKRTYVVETPRPSNNVGIGSVVIVNGQLHRDSYGTGPGLTEVNAQRKINFTAPGKTCPYHVTTMDGGWRGWVTADSVRPA
ncbi:hypothetical protein R4B61_00325 [Fructilactobacillus vespulae]|uniref:hypothetical protein n=1 Tax=Fructilactobacillus vespulae TaxID=1249630 RepID=UPI0039B477E7